MYCRTLPDITSGPDVRKIFKIRTVQKPDVVLSGRQTFNTIKNREICHFFSFFFKNISSIPEFLDTSWFRTFDFKFVSMDLYLVFKICKNVSSDLVWSGRCCPANLGVQSCSVRKLIYPIRSSPTHCKYICCKNYTF